MARPERMITSQKRTLDTWKPLTVYSLSRVLCHCFQVHPPGLRYRPNAARRNHTTPTSLGVQISTSPCFMIRAARLPCLTVPTYRLFFSSSSVLHLSYLKDYPVPIHTHPYPFRPYQAPTATDISMDYLSQPRFLSSIPWFDAT